ncbi:MAG: polymorphic toxin type 44 domain-containing protein [Ezakiella sp.]|nr:polymorphic toxin type 44 domain-containing protein [Ezakiella sp.]MDD7472395.1 polymorphic toxin type 44 domain-containing protein [Bacillota bacterium]MDY3923129.1 polymorphic toxin type 44 domain-containing protein [Ezakiella sp.]
MNKKFLGLVLAMLILFTFSISAKEVGLTASKESSLQRFYDELYIEAKKNDKTDITGEDDVYQFMVNHRNCFMMDSNNYVKLLDSDLLTEHEKEIVENVLAKINNLIFSRDIKLENDFRFVDTSNTKKTISNRAASFDLISECEYHVQQFQYFIDNQSGFKKEIAIARYWIDKVQPGGPWDYKVYLGYNNYYDCLEMGRMSGEDIGNFHYGFVGSVHYSPVILESASGLANIVGDGYIDWALWNSFFDDPNDIREIKRGINEYGYRH